MIHYSCDRCGRSIHPQRHVRYVVRIEVETDWGTDEPVDEDHDFLEELDQFLSNTNGHPSDDVPIGPVKRTYDLCAECYGKFIGNPLGVATSSLGFNPN